MRFVSHNLGVVPCALLGQSYNIGMDAAMSASSLTGTDATMSSLLPFKGEGVQYAFSTEDVCVPGPCVRGLQGKGEKSTLLDTASKDPATKDVDDDMVRGDEDNVLLLLR